MKRKIQSNMLFNVLGLTLILSGSIAYVASGQTRLTYVDTSGSIVDFPSNLPFVNNFIIGGYAERFNLPSNPATVDSVDFVLDAVGSDSIAVILISDSVFVTSTGREHLPDIFLTGKIFARTYIHKQSIIPSSRTHVGVNRAVVPDSFFVLIISKVGSADEFRGIQDPPQNLLLARAALIGYDPQNGGGINAIVDGNFMSGDTTIYADMDIGVTYEGKDGVTMHLSSSAIPTVVWPNPAPIGNPIRLSGADSVISAEVVDEAGRIVRNYRVNDNMAITEIPTQGLSSGVYNVVLFHSDGTTSSVKFVAE